ncbi:MAG: GGDEF domain-containing protein [Aquificota bacterium]
MLDIKGWLKREFFQSLEITPYYQPIIDLYNSQVVGYEALSRFLLKGESLPPSKVFRMAEEIGVLGELDMICRERSVLIFPKGLNSLLFLNVSPSYLASEYFGKNKTLELVESVGLRPESVVLELSEVERVKDVELLKRAIGHYKSLGFLVGIDDIGTGYNSLQLLLELDGHLDFVKFPRELVNGVSRSKIKYQLLKVLTEVSLQMGIRPIYEGVEQEEDVKTLYYELKAHLFQGFYFAKPMPATEIVNFEPSIDLRLREEEDYIQGEVPLVIKLEPREKFHRLLELLENSQKRYFLLDTGLKRFLIDFWKLKYSLNQKLRDLYYYKDLKTVIERLPHLFMDLDSLPYISPEAFKIKSLLEELLSSKYDFLLIKKGQEVQILEKQHLLDLFYKELSKELLDKNPLTQLPGNRAIGEKIEELSKRGEDFYVCYLDLDNFKAFNDTYGFYLGDQMIKKVGLFLSLFEKEDPNKRFVGHIGGDDFIILLWGEDVSKLVEELLYLIKNLQKELLAFYSQEDRERGYFVGKDREENLREFPIASISAVLLKGSSNLLDLSKRSAKYKKLVKAQRGSALFVEDLNQILTIGL